MSPTTSGPAPSDIRAEMRQAVQALSSGAAQSRGRAVTSDLSIDEALLLHSIGWEPVDLVFGVSITSVWAGAWTWGRGEITAASAAHNVAVEAAASRMREECIAVDGHGVVGVRVDIAVHTHHVDVELTGTAVRPVGKVRPPSQVFVSDLSARDFVLLHNAGWIPLGLAFGASFVYAPRRSAGAALRQSSQNVELTNFTEALYSARESAMERMQGAAVGMGAGGIVEVKVTEGPMTFAHHAISFTAWGTGVRLDAPSHQLLRPEMVLPLDDAVVAFDPEALRSK